MQKAADAPILPLPETCVSTNSGVVHLTLFSCLVHRGSLSIRLVPASSTVQRCARRLLLFLEGLVDVVLLREEIALDLGILQQLKVSLCGVSVSHLPQRSRIKSASASSSSTPQCRIYCSTVLGCIALGIHTSQRAALLQVVDTLPPVALAHLVPH
jgi:hypothetical protein